MENDREEKMDYRDEINFISYQLNHYYGVGNWPRRMCADIVGCSITTQRKYENLNWVSTLTEKEKEFFNSKLNFSNGEIIRLFPDGYQYYADKDIRKEKRISKEENLKMPFDEVVKFSKEQELKKYKYNWVIPNKSGLYMLGNIAINPVYQDEKYYLIKIGMSLTNLKKRVSSYSGMNPMCRLFDTMEVPSTKVEELETKYHNWLERNGCIRHNNTEWFIVSEENYNKFLRTGFNTKI